MDPHWCEIIYSYSVQELPESGDGSNIGELVSLIPGMAARRFWFSYDSDLIPSGDTYKEYLITVTAVSGDVVQVSTQNSFTLTVYNPCLDNAYT